MWATIKSEVKLMQEQLNNMTNQVSKLTQLVAENSLWILCDIYLDFRSGSSVVGRAEFMRLLENASNHKSNIVQINHVPDILLYRVQNQLYQRLVAHPVGRTGFILLVRGADVVNILFIAGGNGLAYLDWTVRFKLHMFLILLSAFSVFYFRARKSFLLGKTQKQ